MTVFNLSIIAAALILVVNYYQIGADAFDHVVFQNNRNAQESPEQITSSKEENHTINPNGRHKRYDTVQHIEQFIKEEIDNRVTKRHIGELRNTATESILALTQNVKGNFQHRKKKSQFASNPPSREFLPPTREYLPSNRGYLPPNREYLPPNRGYLPVPEDHVTETTSTRTTRPETFVTVQESENGTQQTLTDYNIDTSTVPGIKLNSTEQTKTVVGIDTVANATMESYKNSASTVPDTELNLTELTKTVVGIDTVVNVTMESYKNNASTVPNTELNLKEPTKTVVGTDTVVNATMESFKNNESNLTEHQQPVVAVTEYSNSTMNTNSPKMNPDVENNNCSNTTESLDHHKEDHQEKYGHVVVHHYHHVYHHHYNNLPQTHHHYYDVPDIDYSHHNVPYYIQDYHHKHNCHNGEDNPISTTKKPCSGNLKHNQHVQKQRFSSYPSPLYYPHYPSYPHFPAYTHHSPTTIEYVSDEDK